MADLEQHIREAQRVEIDNKLDRFHRTQVHLNNILNQHRSELLLFGTKLLQEVERIRQTVDLSRNAMPVVYLDGFTSGQITSQSGSLENMAGEFDGI